MFTPLICGSFHPQEQEDEEDIEAWRRWSLSSTPRKSRKLRLCRSKSIKNPYTDRGLDKFTTLLADLDVKRQKIYMQKGSENISFVRFAYSSSNDCKTIVVKGRDKKMNKSTNVDQAAVDKNPIESPIIRKARVESDQECRKKITSTCDMKAEDLRWPSYYLPVTMILILLVLALFGRSFAILCTSVGWYLVPSVKGGDVNVRNVNKKKDYGRNLSNVKVCSDGISSPRSVLTRINGVSPR